MAALSERDSRRWERLGRRIATAIGPVLAREVLANRTFAASRGHLLSSALRAARVEAAALSCRSQLVLRTDVRRFYPSVTPSIAHASLRLMGTELKLAREAAGMLDGWASEGYAGLPIGPPASAIVANAVLSPVDSDLAGFPFLRWVDDYLIGLSHAKQAPLLLSRLDSSLERQGLERSEAKTDLLRGGTGLRWLGTYGLRGTSE